MYWENRDASSRTTARLARMLGRRLRGYLDVLYLDVISDSVSMLGNEVRSTERRRVPQGVGLATSWRTAITRATKSGSSRGGRAIWEKIGWEEKERREKMLAWGIVMMGSPGEKGRTERRPRTGLGTLGYVKLERCRCVKFRGFVIS